MCIPHIDYPLEGILMTIKTFMNIKFYDLKRGQRFKIGRKTYICVGQDTTVTHYRHCRSKEILHMASWTAVEKVL